MSIHFPDYPEFCPNLTPKDIFQLGSFGGSYFRPIVSNIGDNPVEYENQHLEFPWCKGIPSALLTSEKYDKKINKYKVKVGISLEFWEEKKWINQQDPYGWVQWYCRFYMGRRSPDDRRQIDRWLGVAGKKGRFKNWLLRRLKNAGMTHDDGNISPKISQTLQHWACKIQPEDIQNF